MGIQEKQEALGRLRINKAKNGFDVCKYRQYSSSDTRETDTSTIISGRRRSHWQNSRRQNQCVIKIEEELHWWCVFCEIIPSCNLKCYTLMRVLALRDKGEEPKPGGQGTMVSQRFINNICSPGARWKRCGRRRKSKTWKPLSLWNSQTSRHQCQLMPLIPPLGRMQEEDSWIQDPGCAVF